MTDNLIDWPFRYIPIFSWSEMFPDYEERMQAITDDALHWGLVLDARHQST
jgi:hypothetical protein